MITHNYKGSRFTSTTTREIKGMQGWFGVGNTEAGGFAILVKLDHGKGFNSRSTAQKKLKLYKDALNITA